MNRFNRLAAVGAILALLGVGISGCIVEGDHGPYRYENGDRVDRYGHHESRWCYNHREDEHCH